MLIFKCFNCAKYWTKLVDDGCVSCGAPCEVLSDSTVQADVHETSSVSQDAINSRNIPHKPNRNQLSTDPSPSIVHNSKILLNGSYNKHATGQVKNDNKSQTNSRREETYAQKLKESSPSKVRSNSQKEKNGKKEKPQVKAVEIAPKPIAQLELPDPVIMTNHQAGKACSNTSKRRSNAVNTSENSVEGRRQMNASSFLATRKTYENQGSRNTVDVRIALGTKHNIRTRLPRSVVEA